jgi:hypothetical protein
LTESLWHGQDAVALAEVDDADGFVTAALRLIADEHGRKRLGANALRLYAHTFALSRVVATLKAA